MQNVKADTAKTYLTQQMNIHSGKVWSSKLDKLIWISGDNKPNSIGERIRQRLLSLDYQVKSFFGDIRRDIEHIANVPFESPHALIMCHGVTHLDWFEDVPNDKINEIIDVNVKGTIHLAQSFVQHTIKTAWRKRIIIIGSMAHRSVLNGSAVYCASKAAVAMLTRCLAWELAPKGFDIFCVHPSNVLGTPMTEDTIAGLERYRQMSRKEAEAYWNDNPIRSNILSADDIADVIEFLLSPAAEWLSGSQIELAGGQR